MMADTMTWWHVLVLGIVEGVTEFLPISSTYHLILTSTFLGLPQSSFVTVFEVAIQAGAILAVAALFGRQIWQERKVWGLVAAAFVPTAILGVVLHSVVKQYLFHAPQLSNVIFIAIGIVFLGYEFWLQRHPEHEPKRTLGDLSWQEAALVGVAQATAMLPGVSRAGAVILALLALRVKREQAAYFSFLLAVPTICAAAGLDVLKMRHEILAVQEGIGWLVLGSIVAFVVAIVVLRWLIHYLQHHSLALFGWYRVLFGILVLGWFWWR